MRVLLITLLLWFVESWDPENWFNHTSWVAVVTQTDHPKTVHNYFEIDVLVMFLCYQGAFWIFLLLV